MTIEAFVAKYNGKKVEAYDSGNYAQCTDLVLKWIQEQGHGDLIPLGILNAYELWTKTPSKVLTHYEKVKNTLEAIPRAGDIIVWSDKYGRSGHTAICTGKAGQMQFEAFSQNDPVGVASVVKRYNYNNVLGWLRLKIIQHENMSDLQQKLDKYFNQQVNSDFVISFIDNEKRENTKKDKAITEKDKEILKLKSAIAVLENKNTADLAHAKISYENKIADYKETLSASFEQDIKNYKMQITELQKQIEVGTPPIAKPRTGLHKKLTDLLDAIYGY